MYENLMDEVVGAENYGKALKAVMANKGAPGRIPFVSAYPTRGGFAPGRIPLLEAAGEGTILADQFSPTFRPAFPSSAIISERSSPSRVRFAAPNNGAPLTAPGRSEQDF
jgi:hypothetical protein